MNDSIMIAAFNLTPRAGPYTGGAQSFTLTGESSGTSQQICFEADGVYN
jgi:hypothetical protein